LTLDYNGRLKNTDFRETCAFLRMYIYSFINSNVSNRTTHGKVQYDIKVHMAIKLH